jgi:hypothetical protein
MGIATHSSGAGKLLTVILALGAGTAIVLVMAFLLKNVHQLRHNGTMQIRNAIEHTGNTYLFIPAKRSGQGKVHIIAEREHDVSIKETQKSATYA